MTVEAAPSEVPAVVGGRFRLAGLLATGGEAEVHVARDLDLDLDVVLKTRRIADAADLERLRREAGLLMRLVAHPGLPTVRSDLVDGDRYYMISDHIVGNDLQSLVRAGDDAGLALPTVLDLELHQRLDHREATAHLRPDRIPTVRSVRGLSTITSASFEPAVLAGAVETIARARPYIVIEVLNRRGHDHGVEITEAMAPFGYSYYELAVTPTWQPQPSVRGRAKTRHNDWLLAPEPLDAGFGDRWSTWRSRLDECGPDRNSRVPILLSVRAAMKRGGVTEVYATARRYFAALRRERDQPTS